MVYVRKLFVHGRPRTRPLKLGVKWSQVQTPSARHTKTRSEQRRSGFCVSGDRDQSGTSLPRTCQAGVIAHCVPSGRLACEAANDGRPRPWPPRTIQWAQCANTPVPSTAVTRRRWQRPAPTRCRISTECRLTSGKDRPPLKTGGETCSPRVNIWGHRDTASSLASPITLMSPVTITFELRGQQVTQSGSVCTVALRKVGTDWRLTPGRGLKV
jgi:hypothetical protein